MVFHTVPRCILKRGLQFFHGNVFRFLSYPSPLLFICMTKNDFILNFIWNRQNFPYGPAEEEEGEGNSRKIGLGVDGVLGYQKVSNQSRHAYWDKQKKLKKIRILISRPNSTPKQKSKNYDIYDRIQTKTAGNTYPLALRKRIWLKINAKIGVTEGPNLPPSLLFSLGFFLLVLSSTAKY